MATELVLHPLKMLSALILLVGQLTEVAHIFQSHTAAKEIEAKREGGLGGQQMQVDQAVDSGLHLKGLAVIILRAQGWSAMRG